MEFKFSVFLWSQVGSWLTVMVNCWQWWWMVDSDGEWLTMMVNG